MEGCEEILKVRFRYRMLFRVSCKMYRLKANSTHHNVDIRQCADWYCELRPVSAQDHVHVRLLRDLIPKRNLEINSIVILKHCATLAPASSWLLT
jgi:hypothetical protein